MCFDEWISRKSNQEKVEFTKKKLSKRFEINFKQLVIEPRLVKNIPTIKSRTKSIDHYKRFIKQLQMFHVKFKGSMSMILFSAPWISITSLLLLNCTLNCTFNCLQKLNKEAFSEPSSTFLPHPCLLLVQRIHEPLLVVIHGSF